MNYSRLLDKADMKFRLELYSQAWNAEVTNAESDSATAPTQATFLFACLRGREQQEDDGNV